jgi:hypothetical protein
VTSCDPKNAHTSGILHPVALLIKNARLVSTPIAYFPAYEVPRRNQIPIAFLSLIKDKEILPGGLVFRAQMTMVMMLKKYFIT